MAARVKHRQANFARAGNDSLVRLVAGEEGDQPGFVVKQSTGDYQLGLWLFASLGILAWFGLYGVKLRWRTTWGSAAVTAARV